MMRLVIATPCYQGVVTTQYLRSMLQTITKASAEGIDISVLTVDSDSFIIRSRNNCADVCLKAGFDKLLFIDSDISWEFSHIKKLLSSGKAVVGGSYRLKTPDAEILNFNPLKKHTNYFKASTKTKAEVDCFIQKAADSSGLVEVTHIPTGFLLIDSSVFHTIKNFTSLYYSNGEERYNFFPSAVHNGILESEDWGFCRLCATAGIPVWFDTTVILDHVGSSVFSWTR